MLICILNKNMITSCSVTMMLFLYFFVDPPTTVIYTLSLHDALPIFLRLLDVRVSSSKVSKTEDAGRGRRSMTDADAGGRSEEHTSELQSRRDLVCRLLLEKKKL